MSENWNEVLRNDPIDLSPRPGFEAELRRGLADEWNGLPTVTPTGSTEAVERRTRRWWLLGAAAAAVLVIGGVVVATRPSGDSTVQTPVGESKTLPTSRSTAPTPASEPVPSPTSSAAAPIPDGVVEPAPDTTTNSSAPTVPVVSRSGEEIGSGSIGPPISVPQAWPVGTIYTDLEPQTLVVDFVPPNQQCIVARANATIGRGGAVLVTLFVDAERLDGDCPDGADSNQVRVSLYEPLGDRRVYTKTETKTGGASQGAEEVADAIIGVEVGQAEDAIRAAGFEVRDITGLDAVEEDFNTGRINIITSNGVVEFAYVS